MSGASCVGRAVVENVERGPKMSHSSGDDGDLFRVVSLSRTGASSQLVQPVRPTILGSGSAAVQNGCSRCAIQVHECGGSFLQMLDL